MRQHIRIGGATRAEAVEITWPTSMTVQKFKDVAADQFCQPREGDAKLTRVERKVFAYKHLPEAKH